METEAVISLFTTEHITSISTALNTAIGNVIDTFVALLPTLAIIAGLGFGIGLVFRLFKNVRRGR